jgi:2-oxoglutarate dehydrogenase E1 component
LIVMSPKSMLRHPLAVSPLEEFTTGSFKEVIADTQTDPKKVRKVVLCSGKLYYELYEARQEQKRDDVAIIAIEQLHPFPAKQVHSLLMQYDKKAKIYWVQEEPENMGYWSYVMRTYKYATMEVISRKASASPATGYAKVHAQEQAEIIKRALS